MSCHSCDVFGNCNKNINITFVCSFFQEDVTQDDITQFSKGSSVTEDSLQSPPETFEQSPLTPQQSLNSHSRATSRSSSCSTKRKKNEQEEAIKKICNTLEKESDEFDSVGANVAHKLRKMDSEQKIYAEFLINNILLFGIQKKLCNETQICLNSSYFSSSHNIMASNFPPMQPRYNQQQQTFAPSQPTYNQQQLTLLSTQPMDAGSENFNRNTNYISLVETTNSENEDNGNTTNLPGSLTELLIFKNK